MFEPVFREARTFSKAVSALKVDKNQTIRRPLTSADGSLPKGIGLPVNAPPLIACGPETGNTFCLTDGNQAYVSQDIGDLRDPSVCDNYLESITWLKGQLGIEPEVAVHDLHPDYVSTRYAENSGAGKLVSVQHHHAHAVACMHENGLSERLIAVTFDGMGLGDDGTMWGGEFLVCDLGECERKAHLKQYAMPGGDQATLYPERMAFSYLSAELELDNRDADFLLPGLSNSEKEMMNQMMAKGLNSPLTSSAGRLFDAVAAMIGFSGRITYPAEAALGLQKLVEKDVTDGYTYEIHDWKLNFGPMFRQILRNLRSDVKKEVIAARFHNTLAQGTVDMCDRIREDEGLDEVVLSGGVFYNELLSGLIVKGLRDAGLKVYCHSLLPPGDVCISLGQAVIASVRLELCG